MIKQTLIFRVHAAILDNFEYSRTDLMCWLDIEAFKRIPHQANAKRDDKAKDIREKYLNKKYFFGPSSPATKDEQNEVGIFHPFILLCFITVCFYVRIQIQLKSINARRFYLYFTKI